LEAVFRERLEALQQPADCGAAPLYLFVPHAFASGIGSQLRIVANSMMQARTRCAHHSRCACCACCASPLRPLPAHRAPPAPPSNPNQGVRRRWWRGAPLSSTTP
jgi:hypothetical protein